MHLNIACLVSPRHNSPGLYICVNWISAGVRGRNPWIPYLGKVYTFLSGWTLQIVYLRNTRSDESICISEMQGMYKVCLQLKKKLHKQINRETYGNCYIMKIDIEYFFN